MKFSVRLLNIFFSIAFVVLVSTLLYSYFNILNLRTATKWVDHTNRILFRLEHVHSDVQNAESGVRGYVITGNPDYLASYYGAFRDIKGQLNILDSLSKDNSEQHILMDSLHVKVKERFNIFNKIINLSNSNADDEEIIMVMNQGKITMDQINFIIEQMNEKETYLLSHRDEKAEQLSRSAPTLIIISGLLGFLILGSSYFFIIQDIRSKSQITHELKKKNTLLAYVQQITQLGSYEIDISTNNIVWSDEMYSIFELPKEHLITYSTIEDLVHVEDRKKVMERKNFLVRKDPVDAFEFRIKTLKGTEKVLFSNSYVVFDGEKPIRLIGAALDITNLKMAELNAIEKQQLMKLAKEKAESANEFKTRFLSNMSHEIRTPINAILGFTRILKKQHLSEEQNAFLRNISISGELLLKLIGNILDISKIEEGKVTLDNKNFHLKENIRSSLSPFKYTASEKGLNFILLIDDKIPDYVIGDASRISQIMTNLIGNAIKFTSHGDISVSLNLVNTLAGIATVEFSVTDTGIGIERNAQSTIFESFVQANDSIQTMYGGSGLGLSIVKELVHLMHGDIQLKSPVYYNNQSEGYGSRFSFSIPFTISDALTNIDLLDKHVQILPFPKEVYVLVAEDNEMNQILASYTLDSLGCKFDIVENGELAVKKAQEKQYDIILMDVQMPVCDGLQATKRIRIHNASVPIIGLTANVLRHEVDTYLDAGMNDHIGKPYTEEQLYSIIEKWIRYEHSYTNLSAAYQYVDFTFIENLSKNNKDILKEMLEVFKNQNYQLIQKISDALERNDIEALLFQLHQYKSCVRTLNAGKQISLISEIENKIKTDYTMDAIVPQIRELIATAQLVEHDLSSKLQSI